MTVDLSKSKEAILDDGYGYKEKAVSFEAVVGTKFADKLTGNNRENTLHGRDGNDILTGNGGNDHLDGGNGNDILTGGADGDDFNFYEFGAANADTIMDFVSGEDQIWLDPGVFHGVSSGELPASAFFAGAGAMAATNAQHRVIYDTTTGNLYFDQDGAGGTASELFATLKNAPTLLASDFEIF